MVREGRTISSTALVPRRRSSLACDTGAMQPIPGIPAALCYDAPSSVLCALK